MPKQSVIVIHTKSNCDVLYPGSDTIIIPDETIVLNPGVPPPNSPEFSEWLAKKTAEFNPQRQP